MPRKKVDKSLPELYLVYKITNLVNGKVYIGAHKTRNKNDHYMGSGDLIRLAIKKYGRKNFLKEILYELNSEKEMYDKEREVVQLGKGFYNVINGGGFPLVFTDEIRDKISKASSFNQAGIKNSQYGKIWINNGVDNIKIKKEDPVPVGYFKGRIRYKNISYAMPKGKDSHNAGKHFINNGIKNLFIKSSDIIPDGYVKGRIVNYPNSNKFPCQKGEKNSQFGTKWITNGIKNIILNKGEDIPIGFKLGRLMPNDWIWITDGIRSIKHVAEIEIPEGFKRGKVYKSKTPLIFPELDELIDKIKSIGFNNVAKELGYADVTVRKFLMKNGVKLDRLKRRKKLVVNNIAS